LLGFFGMRRKRKQGKGGRQRKDDPGSAGRVHSRTPIMRRARAINGATRHSN